MECERVSIIEEKAYALIIGRVLRLEVDDEVMGPDGGLDINKARPLLMTGSKKGMRYCTLKDIDRQDPFSAMFPDGKDPLEKIYKD
jgi:flavin reductase (DIM6/NTAB) family NADH-FMN oxidoreductase RutF